MIILFCVRLLLIYEKNKFYMKMGLLRLVADIFLNWLLMTWWGIRGIAWATTILNIVFAVIFYGKLRQISRKLLKPEVLDAFHTENPA